MKAQNPSKKGMSETEPGRTRGRSGTLSPPGNLNFKAKFGFTGTVITCKGIPCLLLPGPRRYLFQSDPTHLQTKSSTVLHSSLMV